MFKWVYETFELDTLSQLLYITHSISCCKSLLGCDMWSLALSGMFLHWKVGKLHVCLHMRDTISPSQLLLRLHEHD